MSSMTLMFVFAALTSLHLSHALECATLSDGIYDIGCKSYSECRGGQIYQHDCPEHKVFNSKTQGCDFESNVAPPCGLIRDCSNVADLSYADFSRNCTSYYTCVHHIYYGHNYCTPGTVFEQTMQTCVWPADAFPPCGTKAITVG